MSSPVFCKGFTYRVSYEIPEKVTSMNNTIIPGLNSTQKKKILGLRPNYKVICITLGREESERKENKNFKKFSLFWNERERGERKWKENFIWRSTFTELSIDLQSKWVGNLRNSSFFPEQSLFIRLNSRNIILVLFFENFPSLYMFFVSHSKNMYIYFSFHVI